MKGRSTWLFALLLFLLTFSACQRKLVQTPSGKRPENVILLIGDGMGLAQVSASFYYQDTPSSFTRFEEVGLIGTSSSSHRITDSAAGATAFSTGKKTYNGAIGVDPDTLPQATLLEIAAAKGKKTGLIATSSITHATPAAFYAHVPTRKMEEQIASQLPDAPVDIFMGGGIRFFARRSDSLNLLDSLEAKGFRVDTSSFPAGKLGPGSRYGFLLAGEGMPKMSDGRNDFLPRAIDLSLDYLGLSQKGFFLMAEGSQIDWGGHANEKDYVIREMLDFDQVVGRVLDFAARDGKTLVIVTADHETGGFALSSATVFGKSDYDVIDPTFSTGGHTATLVPVFAFGPGAGLFGGVYENTGIFDRIRLAMDW